MQFNKWSSALVLFALVISSHSPALADLSTYSEPAFRENVKSLSAPEFARQWIEDLKSVTENQLKPMRLTFTPYGLAQVYFTATECAPEDYSEPTKPSYCPHAWVLIGGDGKITEVGMSFLKLPNSIQLAGFETKAVEVLVFHFSGPNAGKALIENW